MIATTSQFVTAPPEEPKLINIYGFSSETPHLLSNASSAESPSLPDCGMRGWLLALICLIALPIAIVIGVLFAPFYPLVKAAHGRIDGGVKP